MRCALVSCPTEDLNKSEGSLARGGASRPTVTWLVIEGAKCRHVRKGSGIHQGIIGTGH